MLAVYVCQGDVYLPWTIVYWSPGRRFWHESMREGTLSNAIARQSIVLYPSMDTQGMLDTDNGM
jgi:hypothetical protein